MRRCYHRSCDDLSHVTPARLHFLSLTTQSLRAILMEVSAENNYCHHGKCLLYLTDIRGDIKIHH